MNIKRLCALSLLFVLGLQSLMAEGVAVGQWRTHFASAAITQMARRHSEILGLMNTELLCVDKIDNRLSELNLVNGLSGTGLSSVAYSALHDILLVGYSDGRLDFVYGNNDAYTLYDIAVKDLNGGKTIRHIMIEGRYAYLSMPFGVVMVDLQKQEIKETYFIGTDNSNLSVFEMASDGTYLYAATEQGLKYADISATNLNDYTAWRTDTLFVGMEVLYCKESFGKTLVSDGKRIYEGSAGTGWQLFYEVDPSMGQITAMEGSSDFLAISIADTVVGQSLGLILNKEAKTEYKLGTIQTVSSFLWDEDGTFWSGSDMGHLIHHSLSYGQIDSYVMRGPAGNEIFRLASTGNGLTMAAGGYDESFVPFSKGFGGSRFYNESWYTYSQGNLDINGIDPSFRSVTRVLEDPFEPDHLFFSSSVSGVLEKTADDRWFLYNADNSALRNSSESGSSCRVNDMDFDWDGNLWMVNAHSSEGLVGRMRDGTWKSYDLRVAGNGYERPGRIMADYWGTKWIIFNNSQLSVFKTDGNSVQGLEVDLNRGNTLKTSNIYCMVEDQLGHVWIGTDRGVKVIDQHAKMFDSPIGGTSSVSTKTIKVPKDGYLIELLNTQQVRAIAVDGANRKWIGTNGDGVYLVSSDGMEEIHHFTTENSPLLSDNIADIAVYDKTGEVFIGNDLGIVAYRGTATVTEGDPKEEARAFPNPVRPGYQGFISVRGLPQDAIVKITDARGLLIYQGKATGGQISWDGYALNGKRPNSGVLFVFACPDGGNEKLACKIFYVR